jgi:nucleoid-associated protein Lsr2
MASITKVIVTTTDDIDGTPSAKTVRFGLDDMQYDIDLGPENEAKLREFLALFVGHARPVRKRGRKSVPAAKPASAAPAMSKSSEIRRWALEQGLTVPDRGRIAQSVVDAYNAAHTAPAASATPAVRPDPVEVAQLAFEPAPAALS